MKFSKKYFLSGLLFGLVLLFTYIFSQPDGKLHLIFCDVGQGDAVYIKTPGGSDLLIDGGPNDKVLSCLGSNMPFYDRTIDIVVLTHPEKDHLQGLISVLERYSVKYFVIGAVGNQSEGYKKLVKLIAGNEIPYKNLYRGDYFSLDEVRFNVLWPDRNWAAQSLDTEAGGQIMAANINQPGSHVLGLSTKINLNDFSYILHLKYREFDALFTGDGDIKVQPSLLQAGGLPDVELLKFPHHGSKTGIMTEFLDKIKPEAAVISVGKNPWGHPTKEALLTLDERKIKIYRTDTDGEIRFTTDGIVWNN